MLLQFYKYQATGNDFILIDNRDMRLPRGDQGWIQQLCHRRYGIGGDGLMYLQAHPDYDFEMVYYNSDGRESSMCGNGGRCMTLFAQLLGMASGIMQFLAPDGVHTGEVLPDGTVTISMRDVTQVYQHELDYVLDTGSPHFVHFVTDIREFPVVERGRLIRYAEPVRELGINVNFVERVASDSIYVRTYERGVEDETLSCGTGVVASAVALCHSHQSHLPTVYVETLGGKLRVDLDYVADSYIHIKLIGPAMQVFTGQAHITL
jgi:diaminopimelate epimerase